MSSVNISYTDYAGNTGIVILNITNNFRELNNPEDLYALNNKATASDYTNFMLRKK